MWPYFKVSGLKVTIVFLGRNNLILQSDGALIVDGVPEDYDYFNKEEFKKEEVREEREDSSGVQITTNISIMLIAITASLIST